MTRSLLISAVLGLLATLLMAYLLNPPARQKPELRRASGAAGAAVSAEALPICSATDSLAESGGWAALDPDFAAGKRAMAAGDWDGAIRALTAAGLRDDRNADIQNYLGYAYGRLQQLDAAMRHYHKALTLNSWHRSAHEHLGEAYLSRGSPTAAERHLAALKQICIIPCAEYENLKRAMAGYAKSARR
jgi:Flp pilus assembly protein TadD